MKSKWIHRLLIKQQGAYHLDNLYTYWSKLSSQWLVNSSKASCSLRLLRGVPITNGESAKYSSLVWLFSTQSTQEAFLFYEAEVSGSKVSSDGKITLGWKAKIGSCRSESILPFIETYADGPNWLAAIAARWSGHVACRVNWEAFHRTSAEQMHWKRDALLRRFELWRKCIFRFQNFLFSSSKLM